MRSGGFSLLGSAPPFGCVLLPCWLLCFFLLSSLCSLFSLLLDTGEAFLSDLGGKAHQGSARGALAMATEEGNERRRLEQIMPMIEVRGSTLHNFTLIVREALGVDQRILCNACWLCSGWETTRLLPLGWHRECSATRTQLCTSVLSRISGLCNECIRTVTDIRILQHAGLTADGLRGIRLVIYIGMLANQAEWDVDKLYQIPMELAATLDRYCVGGLNPIPWLQNTRGIPLHQMIVLQREYRTIPSNVVIDFIRSMKRLLSRHGDLQRCCILCGRQLLLRWMVILCDGCDHKLVGGRDTLSSNGIEVLYLLHRLVEDIHHRRLHGNTRIPSVEVDLITEGRVQAVIDGTDTGEDWLRDSQLVHGRGPLGGAPTSPPPWGFIVALLVRLLTPPQR